MSARSCLLFLATFMLGEACAQESVVESSKRVGGSQSESNVRPARYKGLVMGKSRKEELIRVLGKPTRIDAFPKAEAVAYVYLSPQREIIARLTAKTGVVLQLEVYPEEPMALDIATKLFGTNFRRTRYDFDQCLNDGGEAPIYESPTGSVEYIEYRRQGVFLQMDEQNMVRHIEYASSPPGPPESVCVQQKKKGPAHNR